MMIKDIEFLFFDFLMELTGKFSLPSKFIVYFFKGMKKIIEEFQVLLTTLAKYFNFLI